MGVGRRQALRRLGDVAERLAERDRTALEELAEGLPLEQFHHDERRALVRPQVVNGADVWVAERPSRAGFLLEAANPLGVAGTLARDDLEGDVTVQPVVAASIDLSHAARADGCEDLVGT